MSEGSSVWEIMAGGAMVDSFLASDIIQNFNLEKECVDGISNSYSKFLEVENDDVKLRSKYVLIRLGGLKIELATEASNCSRKIFYDSSALVFFMGFKTPSSILRFIRETRADAVNRIEDLVDEHRKAARSEAKNVEQKEMLEEKIAVIGKRAQERQLEKFRQQLAKVHAAGISVEQLQKEVQLLKVHDIHNC